MGHFSSAFRYIQTSNSHFHLAITAYVFIEGRGFVETRDGSGHVRTSLQCVRCEDRGRPTLEAFESARGVEISSLGLEIVEARDGIMGSSSSPDFVAIS
jgi:hypothetical protein